MQGHPLAKYLKRVAHVWQNISDVFLVRLVQCKFSFLKKFQQACTRSNSLFSSRAVSGLKTGLWKKTNNYVTPQQHTSCNNIFRDELRRQRIKNLLSLMSLNQWVVNWQKFALNLNWEVNYRELAQREALQRDHLIHSPKFSTDSKR